MHKLNSVKVLFFFHLIFCIEWLWASGHGRCSVKGRVLAIENKGQKTQKIIIQIIGDFRMQGDAFGCQLKDSARIEVLDSQNIPLGSLVTVRGACTNGMTANGPTTSCGYSLSR